MRASKCDKRYGASLEDGRQFVEGDEPKHVVRGRLAIIGCVYHYRFVQQRGRCGRTSRLDWQCQAIRRSTRVAIAPMQKLSRSTEQLLQSAPRGRASLSAPAIPLRFLDDSRRGWLGAGGVFAVERAKQCPPVHRRLCLANIASGQKSFDGGVVARHSTRQCMTSFGRSLRSDSPCRRVETSCSRALPSATSWAYSRVRIAAFAGLIVFFG
jgi:hypothetical protein